MGGKERERSREREGVRKERYRGKKERKGGSWSRRRMEVDKEEGRVGNQGRKGEKERRKEKE